MKLSLILEDKSFSIEYVDPYSPEAGEAKDVLLRNGVRPDSTMDCLCIAKLGGDIVGTVFYTIRPAYEDDVPEGEDWFEYEFSLAVDERARGFTSGMVGRKIGIHLIDAAIEDFESKKDDEYYDGKMYMKLHVINPKLKKFLERRYDFEIDSEYGWDKEKQEYPYGFLKRH